MNKILLLSLGISIIFFAIKLIETKYVSKKNEAVKDISRLTFITFIASAISLFIYYNMKIDELFEGGGSYLNAFVNKPDF